MKIKKINSEIFNKIQQINYFLFVLVFFFNSGLILMINEVNINNIFFVIGNFIIICFFLFINKIYTKEFLKNQKELDKLLKLDKNGSSGNKEDCIYKLFKRNYIKKNIIERDYNILKLNFNKFIPNNFIDYISRGLNEEIEIGLSKEKYLHIMFIDISGFTEISEDLSPKKALILLNIYFDGIVDISRKNGGYIDKFLGDGIMLIFDEINSDNILKTAIEINKLVSQINIVNLKNKITVGIGINSGKATLGTLGSRNRMDITIIGDSVNVASRIENLTRNEKDGILFSQSTYNLIKNKNNFNIEEIGLKKIKGKKEEINIYGIKN